MAAKDPDNDSVAKVQSALLRCSIDQVLYVCVSNPFVHLTHKL